MAERGEACPDSSASAPTPEELARAASRGRGVAAEPSAAAPTLGEAPAGEASVRGTAGATAADTPAPVVMLESAQLRLMVPSESDARALADYLERNHEHLRPWSPPEAPAARTAEGARRTIQKMGTEQRAQTSLRFWIRWRAEPEGPFIGAVSLTNIVLGPFRACYLGYHLDRDLVGRGLMHEALQRTIRYAFDELLLHRIMANYIPSNERSARLLRRLGFVIEGYARDYLFVGGQFHDHVLTSLTNHELADAKRLCTPPA